MIIEPPSRKDCARLKHIQGMDKACLICGIDEPKARQEEDPNLTTIFKSILNQVKNHHASWPFVKPVDKNEVPDYYDYIPFPMGKYTIFFKITKINLLCEINVESC